MAKYKVSWSAEARQDLIEALDFYIERNKSAMYSKKLYAKIKKSTLLLVKNPNLGFSTDCDSVRVLITGDYHII